MAKARRDGAVRLGVYGLPALRLARGLLEFARGWSQVGSSVSLAEARGGWALQGGRRRPGGAGGDARGLCAPGRLPPGRRRSLRGVRG